MLSGLDDILSLLPDPLVLVATDELSHRSIATSMVKALGHPVRSCPTSHLAAVSGGAPPRGTAPPGRPRSQTDGRWGIGRAGPRTRPATAAGSADLPPNDWIGFGNWRSRPQV
jgi:hypothetical protein